MEENVFKEEKLWFNNVKMKLARRIAKPEWDSLKLTNIEWDTVIFISKAKTINELPILINERMVDNLLTKIDFQFKQMKGKEI